MHLFSKVTYLKWIASLTLFTRWSTWAPANLEAAVLLERSRETILLPDCSIYEREDAFSCDINHLCKQVWLVFWLRQKSFALSLQLLSVHEAQLHLKPQEARRLGALCCTRWRVWGNFYKPNPFWDLFSRDSLLRGAGGGSTIGATPTAY